MEKNMKMKRKRQVAMIKAMWIVFAFLAIILVIYISVIEKKNNSGLSVTPEEAKYNGLGKSEYFTETIFNNYYAYLKKSYILIGQYPDCRYIKILSDMERNDYDVDNFYIPDEASFMNYYVDGNPSARVAIDVSSYQKKVDWQAVKAAGVDVALVRVGFRGYEEGKLADDSMFTSHASGALAAGLELGVYFFTEAVSYDEGVEEANYVLSKISGYNVTQPVIIDTEYIYNVEARANDIDNTARTDAILGFCETIKNAGYTPMIYASRNWFAENLDVTRIKDYEFWLAHYSNKPDFPYKYSGWQYTSEGTVSGIENQVDLNVWFR